MMTAMFQTVCTFIGFAVIVALGLTALLAAVLWLALRLGGRNTEE